jgi:hypothetical protein
LLKRFGWSARPDEELLSLSSSTRPGETASETVKNKAAKEKQETISRTRFVEVVV